jgi:hypothetical protein
VPFAYRSARASRGADDVLTSLGLFHIEMFNNEVHTTLIHSGIFMSRERASQGNPKQSKAKRSLNKENPGFDFNPNKTNLSIVFQELGEAGVDIVKALLRD